MILSTLKRLLQPKGATQGRWNRRYEAGLWAMLNDAEEQPRLDVVSQWCRTHSRYPRIPEVGCGEGLLVRRLAPGSYAAFTGIDISDVAIERAREHADAKTRFLCVPMEQYVPDEPFDVIVFSESICYSSDPRRTLRRYQPYLRPHGAFIVTIFENEWSGNVWSALLRGYTVGREEKISNRRAPGIAAYLPHSPVNGERSQPQA